MIDERDCGNLADVETEMNRWNQVRQIILVMGERGWLRFQNGAIGQ
jgi:hypothetical protein